MGSLGADKEDWDVALAGVADRSTCGLSEPIHEAYDKDVEDIQVLVDKIPPSAVTRRVWEGHHTKQCLFYERLRSLAPYP